MIKDVSEGLSKYVPTYVVEDRGIELQELLENICIDLGRVGNLTENNADVEFLLGVVGSYLMAKNTNNLAEDYKPPSYIFNNNLFPMLDEMELTVEDIEDDEEVEDGSL